MIVAELIEVLKKQPQDLKIVYNKWSEQCLLEERDIRIEELCHPRPDGWVQNLRPDMESELYLIFP